MINTICKHRANIIVTDEMNTFDAKAIQEAWKFIRIDSSINNRQSSFINEYGLERCQDVIDNENERSISGTPK